MITPSDSSIAANVLLRSAAYPNYGCKQVAIRSPGDRPMSNSVISLSGIFVATIGLLCLMATPPQARDREQEAFRIIFLTDNELTFLQTQLAGYFPKSRSPEPYLSKRQEMTAFGGWLLADLKLDPRYTVEPLILEVLSTGDSKDHADVPIPNAESPSSPEGKANFAFLWVRVAIKSRNPEIIVTGTIKIIDATSGETIRLVRASRRSEFKESKWVLRESMITDLLR